MDLIIANEGTEARGFRLTRDTVTQQVIPVSQCALGRYTTANAEYFPVKKVGTALPLQQVGANQTRVADVSPKVVLLPGESDKMYDYVRTFSVELKPQLTGRQRRMRRDRWNRSKRTKGVVLNPDDRISAKITVVSKNGRRSSNHTILPMTRLYEACGQSLGSAAITQVCPYLVGAGTTYNINGLVYADGGGIAATKIVDASALGPGYTQAWADETVRQLVVELNKVNKVNTKLTTNVVAAMNQKAFDLSTYFGEIPETMMMITNASKDSLRMAQEASSKVEVLKKNALKETEVIDMRIKNARKRGHKIRMDELYAKKARISFRLAEAIANVWLTYRYGVAPLAYSIEGMMNALDASLTIFQTERQGERVNPSINFRGRSHTIEVIHRCFLRRRHGAETHRIAQAIRKDRLFTAWELAPLSVVIDYFWNIGNVISACGYPTHEFRDFGMYSWKSSGQISYETNNAVVTIDFDHYRCFPTTLLEFIELHWDPLLTVKRQMDLVAISWHAFKGTTQVNH